MCDYSKLINFAIKPHNLRIRNGNAQRDIFAINCMNSSSHKQLSPQREPAIWMEPFIDFNFIVIISHFNCQCCRCLGSRLRPQNARHCYWLMKELQFSCQWKSPNWAEMQFLTTNVSRVLFVIALRSKEGLCHKEKIREKKSIYYDFAETDNKGMRCGIKCVYDFISCFHSRRCFFFVSFYCFHLWYFLLLQCFFFLQLKLKHYFKAPVPQKVLFHFSISFLHRMRFWSIGMMCIITYFCNYYFYHQFGHSTANDVHKWMKCDVFDIVLMTNTRMRVREFCFPQVKEPIYICLHNWIIVIEVHC